MKYLVISANGYGNAGDDLIAYTIKSMLEQIDSHADVKLSRPPFNAELSVWADVTIVGGGGILYDHDIAHENIRNYMTFIESAHVQKKLACVVGVGEQGIVTATGKFKYKRYLNQASLITVRSIEDKENLEKIGVRHPIHAFQDVVFALDSNLLKTTPRHLRVKITDEKPILGFNLAMLGKQGQRLHLLDKSSGQSIKDYSEYIQPENLKGLFEHFRVKLICLSADDLAYYDNLSRIYDAQLVYKKHYKTAELLEHYNKCDLLLTSRFHGLIIGALLFKPVVAVGIKNQKTEKLIQENFPSIKNSFYDLESFVKKDTLKNLLQNYKERRIVSAEAHEVNACRQLALKHKDCLKKILTEHFGPQISQIDT